MKNKPRKPWAAGLLTFFTIGLGHLYCGEINKGIRLYVAGQVFVVFAYSSYLFYAPVGPAFALAFLFSYMIYCIIDSARYAKASGLAYSLKNYNKWYVYLICWFVAGFCVHSLIQPLVKANIAQAYKIPSGAMKQTIQVGDHIVANKLIYKVSSPKRGDIIIFPFPEEPSKVFIKRVIAIGGETIEIKNKQVYIDGKKYHENYKIHSDSNIIPKDIQPRDNFEPIKIPEDSLFVMGDNRDHSYDSRFWGFVKKSSAKGKATRIYWSWDKNNFKVRWNRIGNTIR